MSEVNSAWTRLPFAVSSEQRWGSKTASFICWAEACVAASAQRAAKSSGTIRRICCSMGFLIASLTWRLLGRGIIDRIASVALPAARNGQKLLPIEKVKLL